MATGFSLGGASIYAGLALEGLGATILGIATGGILFGAAVFVTYEVATNG